MNHVSFSGPHPEAEWRGIGKDAFAAIACETVAAGQDEAGVKVRLSQESGITVGDNPAVGFPSSVGRAALGISSPTKWEGVRTRRLIRSRQVVLVGLGDVCHANPTFC